MILPIDAHMPARRAAATSTATLLTAGQGRSRNEELDLHTLELQLRRSTVGKQAALAVSSSCCFRWLLALGGAASEWWWLGGRSELHFWVRNIWAAKAKMLGIGGGAGSG